jgi:hypothetical protein
MKCGSEKCEEFFGDAVWRTAGRTLVIHLCILFFDVKYA